MAKLVAQNHQALHSIAEEVTKEEFKDGTVKKIINGMKKAIKTYDAEGYTAVAIAAPQIGVAKRIFLVEDQSDDEDRLPSLVAINPKILKTSKKTSELSEGCLSVPNNYGIVKRHNNVTFKAQDETGEWYERGAGGLLAQIIQHECDHLDGTLFIDRAEKVWDKDNPPEEIKELMK
jgi:peptide deformylase